MTSKWVIVANVFTFMLMVVIVVVVTVGMFQ